MKRIHIGAAQLMADGFRLELGTGDTGVNLVELKSSGGVTGTYEQDDEQIRLRSMVADKLVCSEFSWRFGDVSITLIGASQLGGVYVDGAIPLSKNPGQRVAGEMRAASAEVQVDLRLKGILVRLSEVRLRGLDLRMESDGRLFAGADSIELGAVELFKDGLVGAARNVAIEAPKLTESGASVAEFSIGELLAEVDHVAKPAETAPEQPESSKRDRDGGKEANRTTSAPTSGPSWQARIAELALFDHLHGHVNADVVTDVTVPILGRRRATHRFRIPIDHGVINFRSLERNLAFLEDLVVHLKRRKQRLVLEKDVPFIPFDRKTLVYWQLDGEGELLAEDKKVRLRTLLHPQVPQERVAEAEKDIEKRGSAVVLRELEVGHVDVALEVDEPTAIPVAGGQLWLGRREQAGTAVAHLVVRGELHHHAGVDPEGEPGELVAESGALKTALDGIALKTWRLSAASLDIASLGPSRLTFTGLRPGSARASLQGVTGSRVRLDAAATSRDD